MPANDIYELSIDATYNSQQVTNVIHWLQIGADGSGDGRTALANMWANLFAVPQLNCQVDSVVHVQNRARRLFPVQTQTSIFSDVGVGNVVQNGLPSNQCAILRFYGALSGRKGVGHQKMYGVAVTFQLAGRLSTAWRDTIDPYGLLFASDQSDISGYVFRAGVLGTDNVLRQIQNHDALPRVKQIHSRTAGVGD